MPKKFILFSLGERLGESDLLFNLMFQCLVTSEIAINFMLFALHIDLQVLCRINKFSARNGSKIKIHYVQNLKKIIMPYAGPECSYQRATFGQSDQDFLCSHTDSLIITTVECLNTQRGLNLTSIG